MIIGRQAELEQLVAAATDVTGPGGLVAVRGPVGHGKSVLLDAAADRIRQRDGQVLLVRPAPEEDRVVPQPLLRVIRAHFEANPQPALLATVSMLGRLACASGDQVGTLRTSHELGAVLTAVAAVQPTVIMFDDLHRLDPTALPPLELALRRLRASRISIVVTVRAGTRAELDLADLGARVVDLGPLEHDGVAELVARTLRAHPAPALLAAVRAALGPSAGDPSAVLSLLRRARADGMLRHVDGTVLAADPAAPLMLTDDHHLMSRSSGTAVVEVATALAVLGRTRLDDLPVVGAALDRPLAEAGEVVDVLTDARVLDVDTTNGALRFAVPAVAHTLAARWTLAGTARLHRLLAHRLASTFRQDGHRDRWADLADHLVAGYEATPSTLSSGAELLLTVADQLVGEHPDRAATWFRHALAMLGPADPRWTAAVPVTLRLLHALGRHRELAAFAADCERAAARHTEFDVELMTDIVLHEALALLLTERRGAIGVLATRVAALTATGRPMAALADYLARLAVGQIVDDRDFPAQHPLARPLALLAATTVGDAWSEADHPVRRHVDAMVAEATPDRAADLWSALTYGDLVTLWEAFTGAPGAAGPSVFQSLRRATHAGRWDEALGLVHRIEVDLGNDPESRMLRAARVFAADIHIGRGEDRRATDWLSLADEGPLTGPALAAARCRVTLATEHADAALEQGRHAVRRLVAQGHRIGLAPLMATLVELTVAQGGTTEADDLLDGLRDMAARTGDPAVTLASWTATAVRTRDVEPARRALALARVLDQPGEVARCCVLLGELDEAPEPLLREAQELFRRLDSVRGRATVARVMRDRGIAVPRRRARPTELSVVEHQVAMLVGDGLTNRQIAVRLRVSEKTVEGYLTRIFAKTGCRSRVRLVARFDQRRSDVG